MVPFRVVGDAHEVASLVVFLEGLPAERIYHFGDLLKDVAYVFSGVFVAVDLLLDLAGAIVFGFGDRFVGFFDLGLLVVGIVGVCRLVAFWGRSRFRRCHHRHRCISFRARAGR